MSEDLKVLAESCGFRPCAGGFRRVEPGVVASLMEDAEHGFVLRQTFLGDDGKETYEDPMTVDEAKGFLKAVNAVSSNALGYGYGKKEKVTYKSILKKINPEHWRRDRAIANRYALPQMGGAEHDEDVVGRDGMQDTKDTRMIKFTGRTFWRRPDVPGGYIDDLPSGANNG